MIEQTISPEMLALAIRKGFTNYECPLDKLFGLNIPSTQSVLQKWLRDVHGIHIYIQTTPSFDTIHGSKWQSDVRYCFQPFKWTTGHYYIADTYELALEQALEKALNLLEDAGSKNN